ncbi:MAG: glycosyltransferase [Bacteroidetes bacterium]|nr:glycosyltransferase [Bacteroidota bacterium]
MQLSVVIPTCNRHSRLVALLTGLLHSEHPIHEVIIVDASDMPLPPENLAAFHALNILYLRSEPSVCIQRNMGIHAAASPWVFLCDDDIEMPADYLIKLVGYAAAHPEAGAISGTVLQVEKERWVGTYPIRSGKELVLKSLFGLSIWGRIECSSNNRLVQRIKTRYQRRGNHIAKSGWPVLTHFSTTGFITPVYGLGASIIRREWLLASAFDEVLDPHGIGDNYGVAMGFPDRAIHVFPEAYVYHHQEAQGRLEKELSYYRRALALDYFIRTGRSAASANRLWLFWSLWGNFFVFFLKGQHTFLRPALLACGKVLTGSNPYLKAARHGLKKVQPDFRRKTQKAHEGIMAHPWKSETAPKRILAIRLQAMGDVVITLPYLQGFRQSLPEGTQLDFLTRVEVADIPRHVDFFRKVYALAGGRSFKRQALFALLMLPKLWLRRYDAVIDLQNNRLSRFLRKLLAPKAWTSFDRFSLAPAGERTRAAIDALALHPSKAVTRFTLKGDFDPHALLKANGWDESSMLFVLNPAGAFENRNWPMEEYVAFVQRCLAQFPKVQFVLLGLEKIAPAAAYLKASLGDRLINLVSQTKPSEAFAILQCCALVLSEDSGLMHMAWVSGIPTLALFGASRSIWSQPLGTHTAFFDSSDLSCGNCLLPACPYTGNRKNYCMTRIRAEAVFQQAIALMQRKDQERLSEPYPKSRRT